MYRGSSGSTYTGVCLVGGFRRVGPDRWSLLETDTNGVRPSVLLLYIHNTYSEAYLSQCPEKLQFFETGCTHEGRLKIDQVMIPCSVARTSISNSEIRPNEQT